MTNDEVPSTGVPVQNIPVTDEVFRDSVIEPVKPHHAQIMISKLESFFEFGSEEVKQALAFLRSEI